MEFALAINIIPFIAALWAIFGDDMDIPVLLLAAWCAIDVTPIL